MADDPTPTTVAQGLDPYGQLVRMLMPRAQLIAIYASNGRTLWLSEGQDDPSLHAFSDELLGAGGGTAGDIDGTTRRLDDLNGYAFVLRDAAGTALAALAMLVREGGEPRPFSLVLGLLRPALECLQRELTMRVSMGAIRRDLSARDRDLELLLDASPEPAEMARDAQELTRLVQSLVDHLGCGIGALIIPERSIAVVRLESGRQRGQELQLITRTHRHLLSWAQLQRRTMIVNKVSANSDKVPPYKILSVPVRHASQRVIGFLALFNPTEAADFENRHVRLAELLARKVTTILQNNYDAATGLLVRGAFERQVESILAQRASGAAADSVVYLDIDQLHVINENFGMPVGDATIARVAEVIRRKAPGEALVARVAGDRFALFLPNATADQANQSVEVIRAAVAELTQTRPEGTLRVSVSAGVAEVPAKSKSPLSHALAAAEVASKTAKEHGRDRIETVTADDISVVRRNGELRVVADLREAITTNRFRLFAQPILPLAGSGEPHFEILIRLLTERGELLPAAKFLPAAEKYELMPAIDQWVVDQALAELGEHAAILRRKVGRFCINISAQSLVDPAVAGSIAERVQRADVAPDLLTFEVQETAAVAHLDRAEFFMQRLKHVGCRLALDEFGVGASSLAFLKALPVSMLKLDGSLVRDVLTNSRSESMIRALAQLARGMDIATVAGFVETDDLRMRMSSLGIDYGQGFAVARPAPLGDILQGLALCELVDGEPKADRDDYRDALAS